MRRWCGTAVAAAAAIVIAGCAQTEPRAAADSSRPGSTVASDVAVQPSSTVTGPESPSPTATSVAPATPTPAVTAATPTPAADSPAPSDSGSHDAGVGPDHARPAWLGTRVLPLRPDAFGQVLPTPPELRDRRLAPPELFPPPEGDRFTATVGPVLQEVANRSTWAEGCPVALDDLRYITLTFWGFDDRPHTGELLVHASAADDLVDVFGALYEARFPIEEMRVVSKPELDAPPTGDGNNTTAFVCRPGTGGSSWSQHAYGLAVDVNPFHNPYVKGDLVLPELASAYTDRSWRRPGMVLAGTVVTDAFAEIGWGWGGNWDTLKDWMHFSANDR